MIKTLTPPPKSTLLFEGDSMTSLRLRPCLDTWAWQRLTNAHINYAEKVGDWIFCNRPDLGLSVRNAAVAGDTMTQVLQRFPSVVEALKPAIVVMTIGSNDAAQKIPLEPFRSQMREYCSKLSAFCGGKVLYLGERQLCPGSPPSEEKNLAVARPYCDAAFAEVEAHGGLAIDYSAILCHKEEALKRLYKDHTVFHDGIHLNAVGAEIVAGIVLRALGLMTTPGDPSFGKGS